MYSQQLPNLVFVKPHKVGGSTCAGVIRRIGQKHGLSGSTDAYWIKEEPGVWANHMPRKQLQKKIDTLSEETFILTWMRDPIERCLSNFYHIMGTRRRKELTGKRLQSFARQWCTPILKEIGPPQASTNEDIFEYYDFIGVTERFAESMLVLKHKLSVDMGDMLYVRAKDSHKLHVDLAKRVWVPHVPFRKQSAELKEIMNNFNYTVQDDWEMLAKANELLDEEISKIPNWKEELEMYRLMLEEADLTCPYQTNCMWKDNGCGQKCLDGIAAH